MILNLKRKPFIVALIFAIVISLSLPFVFTSAGTNDAQAENNESKQADIEWEEAVYFLNKQSKEGSFIKWNDDDQILLVDSLIREGIVDETHDSISLRDEAISKNERAEYARGIMENWLSMSPEFVSFQSIMQRHWGQFQTWTVEQKAWYTDTLIKAEVQSPDQERFVLPSSGQIPQEMAERIAKAWASVWFDIPLNEMNQYSVYAALVIFPKEQIINGETVYTTENMRPEWEIDLVPPPLNGEAQGTLLVFIDAETGTVDVNQLILSIRMKHYGKEWPELAVQIEGFLREQEYKSFFDWSTEAKAAFSKQFREQVLAQDEGVLDVVTRAFATYQYDMPESNAISEQQAIMQAKQVLVNQAGVENDVLEQYDQIHTYYDTTVSHSHKWRILFTASGKAADLITKGKPNQLLLYRVEVDAITSEKISVNHYQFDETIGFEGILAQL